MAPRTQPTRLRWRPGLTNVRAQREAADHAARPSTAPNRCSGDGLPSRVMPSRALKCTPTARSADDDDDAPAGEADEPAQTRGEPLLKVREPVHARSTTLAPSRPCGRNTRTKMSNTKAQTSFQAEPPKVPGMKVAMTSTTPSTNPPTTAPLMLPMPPSTAAVKALRPARKPILKSMLV